jgi:hypothetical protein
LFARSVAVLGRKRGLTDAKVEPLEYSKNVVCNLLCLLFCDSCANGLMEIMGYLDRCLMRVLPPRVGILPIRKQCL